MNINYNLFFQKIMPYLIAITLAYVFSSILFFFLPKSGVEFNKSNLDSNLYKKYEGFYSTKEVVFEKKSIEKQNIQKLSRYKLQAVYSTSSNKGWIVIQEKNSNKTKILEYMDEINGYVLNKLFKTYVVFEKNKETFKLELPKNSKVNYEIEESTQTVKVKDDEIQVNRNYLNSYVNDMNKVWENIQIKEQRNKSGKIEGFKVFNVKKESIFNKLGLKKNDLIQAVNGNELKSYADAFKVYNDINKINYLKIEILRNNEIVELNYEID